MIDRTSRGLWKKDWGSYIIEVSDGYIVVGVTAIYGTAASCDAWLIKFNRNNGEIIWDHTYGGDKYNHASSVIRSNLLRRFLELHK